eukprot:4511109-Ditylum_brightwellii.AAC.1
MALSALKAIFLPTLVLDPVDPACAKADTFPSSHVVDMNIREVSKNLQNLDESTKEQRRYKEEEEQRKTQQKLSITQKWKERYVQLQHFYEIK